MTLYILQADQKGWFDRCKQEIICQRRQEHPDGFVSHSGCGFISDFMHQSQQLPGAISHEKTAAESLSNGIADKPAGTGPSVFKAFAMFCTG